MEELQETIERYIRRCVEYSKSLPENMREAYLEESKEQIAGIIKDLNESNK